MKQQSQTGKFIFISYNSKDKAFVEKIARWLKKQGLNPWLDQWEIKPGTSILDNLETALKKSHAIIICIGKEGYGPWHREEIKIAKQLAVHRQTPVIPLFLPGCPANPEIPLFLADTLAIDFRSGLHDKNACKKLLWAVTNENPHTTTPGPITPAGDLYDLPVMGKYARALVHRYTTIDFLGIRDVRDKKARTHNDTNLKKLRITLNKDLEKLGLNCHRITEKMPDFFNADHKHYVNFSSIVLFHMGFVLFYRWRFLEHKLKLNYPNLDRFIDTAGGLLNNSG